MTVTLTFDRQALPFRTDFVIAGTRCLLSTNSHDILRAAARWRPAVGQPGVAFFEVEIVVDPAMDAAPEHAAHFRGLRHLVFAFLPPRSFVTYDLQRRRVHAVLSVAAASDYSFWGTLLLPITIGVLGTTVGVAPLHCACLERNGCGILVAGVSGAGKSTLSTALAYRGFSFISDDWTFISKQQSSLVAHGLSSPIKLLPDTIRFFSRLAEFRPGRSLNGEIAYEVDPRDSFAFHVKAITRPRYLFFLERTSTPGCSLLPSRPEYVRDFFENSGERLSDELEEAKACRSAIIQALSSRPCWILRTGEGPQQTAEALDHFLSELNDGTA